MPLKPVDGFFEVCIPLMEKTDTPEGTKYTIDITGTPNNSFITKDSTTYLMLEFKVAGVKIPPELPRPVGTPIGRCTIRLKQFDKSGGGITIPENVELQGKFVGLQDDRLKTATFRVLIPVSGAAITESWE